MHFSLIIGYIEESVGRIEMATATTAGNWLDDGEGQPARNNNQGEGHTLGGDSTETLQEPSAPPSAEEVRERRLAFFKRSSQDTAKTNNENNSGQDSVNDNCVEDTLNTGAYIEDVKPASKIGKAPSKL